MAWGTTARTASNASWRRARDEQRRAAPDNLGGDGGDLGRRLAQAEDDLGEALADRPVVIDAGEAEVLERLGAQRLQQLRSRRRRGRAVDRGVLDLLERGGEDGFRLS